MRSSFGSPPGPTRSQLPLLKSLACLLFLASPCLALDKEQPPIHFESDTLQYQEGNQVIVASGNVKVRQSSYTFFSDYATFNIPRRSLEALGTVRFSDVHGNEIRSRFLSFDAEKQSAKLLDAEGSFGPWIFAAKRVQRDEAGNFLLERSRISTCEEDLSKYHLYGYRVRVMPQRRLTVWHALFRLGPVPVLYLPYYYHSLGEKHLAFQLFPGQNQSEGAFVRSIWGYPITDETYLRAYADYLSKRGTGTGGEFNYYFSDKAKGSIYGYRIDDRITFKERWNARLYHWQALAPGFVLQSKINRLSDDQFPNDFFREDFDRVVRDFKSDVALTYQKRNWLVRALGQRTDLYDTNLAEFSADEALAPRLEVNQYQSPLGLAGLEKILFLSYAHRFAGKTEEGEVLPRRYRREGDVHASLLRNFRLLRRTTFTPKLTLRNKWSDRPQLSEHGENSIQRLDTEGALRQRFGTVLDVDLRYILTRRFQDNQGDDRGIENHRLSFFSSLRPATNFDFRFDTAHLLPRLKGQGLAFLDPARYDPLRGEILWTPRNMEIFFREEYTLYDPLTTSPHPLNTQAEFTLGQRNRGQDYVSMGTSYFNSRDHAFEMRHAGRFSVSRRLKLEGVLRTLLSYDRGNFFHVRKGEFLEKELLVKTEWRCWLLSFTFRERKGVLEFLFNLELQLDRAEREKNERRDQEAEFYPWRGWGN